MRCSIFFTLYLCVVPTVISDMSKEVESYNPLFKSIRDKYNCADVIIVPPTNYRSLEKITDWYNIVRALSHGKVYTSVLSFSRLRRRLNIDEDGNSRILIVTIVDTLVSLNHLMLTTKNLDTSYGIWLILFTRHPDHETCHFCRDPPGNSLHLKLTSRMFISCCHSNVIEEWWSVEENRTETQKIGQAVNGNQEIIWASKNSRRHYRYSLHGRGLRIAILNESEIKATNSTKYRGFIGEVINELMLAMNFTISDTIREHVRGVWNPRTNHWNGLMGRINRHEADIAATDFLLSNERSVAVQYLIPITSGSLKLYFRRLDVGDLMWSAHFKVLGMNVWLTLVALVLTTPLLLTLVTYRRTSHFFPLLFENFTNIWGIYCQQGLSDLPSKTSLRIAYVSILISALIISSAYSARIISTIAMSSTYAPFTTIQEFVEDGTYSVIVLRDTAMYDNIKISKKVGVRSLIPLMKPVKLLPVTYHEALTQVCRSRVGFYVHETMLRMALDSAPCDITSIDAGGKMETAMIVPRDSEFINIFNYHLRRFTYSGIISRLRRKYYSTLEQQNIEYTVVEIQGVVPLLLLLSSGMVAAIVIFIIERNAHVHARKQHTNKWAARINIQRVAPRRPMFPWVE